MPQMSPLPWVFLLISVVVLVFFFCAVVYFIFKRALPVYKKPAFNFTNWKW